LIGVYRGKKKTEFGQLILLLLFLILFVVGYCTDQLGFEGFDRSCDQWQVGAATHDEEEAENKFWNRSPEGWWNRNFDDDARALMMMQELIWWRWSRLW
jgi:hypothetical protein